MNGIASLSRVCILAATVLFTVSSHAFAAPRDLDAIKKDGVLRHLGVVYANFVTGLDDGLDVELIKQFAKHLGVKYEYVKTDWDNVLTDLTGLQFEQHGANITITNHVQIKGDIVANGLTILEWRHDIVDFSIPTFPTQVWLIAKSDSKITPIQPTGDITKDIALTREKLKNISLLCKTGGCLDPALYNLEPTGARPKLFPGNINDLAPAVIMGEAEATLLDVPDALVALQKYPGSIKVIGPLSELQGMAVGFAKEQPHLREEFNKFFMELKESGEYDKLVNKYYPLVYSYFPGFFAN